MAEHRNMERKSPPLSHPEEIRLRSESIPKDRDGRRATHRRPRLLTWMPGSTPVMVPAMTPSAVATIHARRKPVKLKLEPSLPIKESRDYHVEIRCRRRLMNSMNSIAGTVSGV